MFIERRVPKETLRSSGARYSFVLTIHCALTERWRCLLCLAINIWPLCGQGQILSANFRNMTLVLTRSESDAPSDCSHRGQIFPKILQTVRAAKQCREIGRVDHHNVARTIPGGREPEQAVKFTVTRCRERVRSIGIDRLTGQHLHGLPVAVGQFVMRQMWMKVECGHIVKQSELVEISEGSQRRDVARAFGQCGPQTPTVPDRNLERLQQRTRVRTESLLARHQGITMMLVFHLPLL